MLHRIIDITKIHKYKLFFFNEKNKNKTYEEYKKKLKLIPPKNSILMKPISEE